MKSFILILFLSAALIIAGCTDRYKVEVESDTSWGGVIDGISVQGEGNQTIDIDDNDEICVLVSKQTERGYLIVKVINDGNSPSAPEQVAYGQTFASYGEVMFCLKQ